MTVITTIFLGRGIHHFYGRYPGHPIVTGENIYPVVEKTNDERIGELETVNDYVNNRFEQAEDVWEPTGQIISVWNFMSLHGPTEGDCEDFAITKIQMLLELGWSIDNLFLEIGYRQDAMQRLIGHVWTIARWGNHEFVLNTRETKNRLWSSTGHILPGLIDRATIKNEYPMYGIQQIKGTKWGYLVNSRYETMRQWGVTTTNFELSSDENDHFNINPISYTVFDQPAIHATGTVTRK